MAKHTPGKRDPWIVTRLGDVARFFRRSVATVKGDWRANGMPGANGAWDLQAILEWRDARQPKSAAHSSADIEARQQADTRRAIAEANLAERRDRQSAGELVEVDQVRRLFVQHISEARALLGEIPDRILAALPPKTLAKTRMRMRDETRRLVDQACDALADGLRAIQTMDDTPCDDQ